MRLVSPLLLVLAATVICPQDVTAKPRTVRRARSWSLRLVRARQLQSQRLGKRTKMIKAGRGKLRQTLGTRNKTATGKKIHYKTRFSFLRRVIQLAVDPAHRKMTRNSKREAVIGATLEAQGRLPGPIKRERTGKSEFVDARGVKWDVKGFNSNFPQNKGGFKLERAVSKLRGELAGGENVILDRQNLKKSHQRALKREIKRNGWESRIIWFP
jgi:hypothetical protein